MSETPVYSPDGQYMWTGKEWIPAPPVNPSNQSSIQDSVVMGDVTTIMNVGNTAEVKNYILTMIDRLKQGRFEKAQESLDLAKKINHPEATKAYTDEYKLEISKAWRHGLVEYYRTALKGKAPAMWNHTDETMLPLVAPLGHFFSHLDELLDYNPKYNAGWRLQASVALEFRGFRLSQNKTNEAIGMLHRNGDIEGASKYREKLNEKNLEDTGRLIGAIIFFIIAAIICFLVFASI
jgi:hypothetical protein